MSQLTEQVSIPNKLARAPLVYVVAQVRYSPILEIKDSVIEIQRQLKGIGFPRYEQSQIQNIVLDTGSAPRVDNIERWDFLDREKGTGVVLTRDFVLLHTKDYDTFTAFSQVLKKVLAIIKSSTDVDNVERVGIRYVDLVRLQSEESFSSYLQPGLIGYPFAELKDVDVLQSFSRTESAAVTREGGLSIRSFQLNDGQFLPPDLWPSSLQYDLKLNPGEVVTILDFDHYSVNPMDFDTNALINKFDLLHKAANSAFRMAVTPYAVKRWNEENV
jgi:uncharacterized protein (TIGR04255 family)